MQLAAVFMIVGLPSLFGSGLCALLKWEDKKARRKDEQPISCDTAAEPGTPDITIKANEGAIQAEPGAAADSPREGRRFES